MPVQVSVHLGELSRLVDQVAAEEEVIGGLDGQGEAHKGCRVDAEGEGHLAGDSISLNINISKESCVARM